METKKRALGKGLEQLFDLEQLNVKNIKAVEQEIYDTAKKEEITDIEISQLRPNPYQPRQIFDEESLKELAASIDENGVFQPIIVKKSIKGYEIIAGERRYRASKLAGKETIPAIIREFTDDQMAEIALLENLQRENLNALEEAKAYKNLLVKLNLTQDQLSKKVSKSRSYITNMIGLLRLPDEVQQMLLEDKISMSHARVLSKLEDKEKIIQMANEIVNNKMPVHKLEHKTGRQQHREESNEYRYVEDLFRDKLDTKIKIKDKKITISFENNADLNRILEVLNIKE